VDALEKLAEVLRDGCGGYEIDLIYRQAGAFFEVAHDEETKTGVDLVRFLEAPGAPRSLRIWFDVKNADPERMDALVRAMQDLDRKYGLRERIIFESQTTSPALARMVDAGFHVSYYLDTEELEPLVRAGDEPRLDVAARRIARQASLQRVGALSFDAALYPFVKRWVEPRLSGELAYHTWDLGLPLTSRTFLADLERQAYFRDLRVRTILVPYESSFSR
jgi:hypothetical protein